MRRAYFYSCEGPNGAGCHGFIVTNLDPIMDLPEIEKTICDESGLLPGNFRINSFIDHGPVSDRRLEAALAKKSARSSANNQGQQA